MEPEQVSLSEMLGFSERQLTAQQAVLAHKYTLYGGAVGGGKSYFIRWMMVDMLVNWFLDLNLRNIEVSIFCEDYPTLKDRQLGKILKEFPEWLGKLHDDHKAHGKCYILAPEYGSGIIKFRNLDDPSKYQSAEFAAIAVDELTKNPKDTFLDLKHRLRWPGIEDTRFFAGTNPGGAGHAWVKKLWMDKDFEEEELDEKDEYFYVPAKAEDNPHLPHSYLKQLDTLPPEMRRALRDGDWDIFKGQFFSNWRRVIHVCKPFKVPEHWRRFVCGDYGYAAPSAVYWVAVDENGIFWVYRELYRTGLTYEQLAKEIIAMTPDDEQIDYWVFDPAIWAKSGANATAMSGADIMEQVYTRVHKELNVELSDGERRGRPRYVRLLKGDNNRVIGWGLMREKLKPMLCADGETRAGMQVFDTCPNAIRTIPALVYDKNNIEDCNTDGEDHAADAIRYGLMSNPSRGRTREEQAELTFKRRMAKKRKDASRRLAYGR